MVFSAVLLKAFKVRENERRREDIRFVVPSRELRFRASLLRAARACLLFVRERLDCLGGGVANGLWSWPAGACACAWVVPVAVAAATTVCRCRDDDKLLRCVVVDIGAVPRCGQVQLG